MYQLFVSDALRRGLRRVLSRDKFAVRLDRNNETVDSVIAKYEMVSVNVVAPPIPPVILADPTDDAVLACAKAAHADVIESGDPHLLALGEYEATTILDARALLDRLTAE